MRGPEFMELRAFELVARHRSYSRAAENLEMSRSALSHLVKNLEQRVGTRLLDRTTRSVAPTEAGEALLRKFSPALQELLNVFDGTEEFSQQDSGTVRILSSPLGAALCIEPHLVELAMSHPHINLEVRIGDSTAELPNDFDAVVKLDTTIGRDFSAARLSDGHQQVLVASPGYLSRYGRPGDVQALRAHKCISTRRPEMGDPSVWRLEGLDDVQSVLIGGGLQVNDDRMAISAAVDGLGIALVVEELARGPLRSGELEVIFPSQRAAIPGFMLCCPRRALVRPPLTAFIGFLEGRRREMLAS